MITIEDMTEEVYRIIRMRELESPDYDEIKQKLEAKLTEEEE